MVECADCGLRYSDLRLNDEEVGILYAGYRGPAYFRLRHAHEPWYAQRVNGGLGCDPRAIKVRQEHLEKMLKAEHVWDEIRTILDFGGDRGQFIPAPLIAEKWVYEISSVEPIPGVRACSRLEDLGGRSFDLVMLCHVLEHAMDPAALIRTNASLLSQGGILYVEIPLERPHISGGRLLRVTNPHLHKAYDFISTLPRVILGWLPPGALLKISEHVNFFHEQSLRQAMEMVGLEVLRLEARDSWKPFGRSGTLHCLARRPLRAPERQVLVHKEADQGGHA